MQYVIIHTDDIEEFNRQLNRLIRPAHLRDEGYVTDLQYVIHTHPISGDTALAMPPEEEAIHPDATTGDMMAVINNFVARGSITPQEANGMRHAILDNRGEQVTFSDFIPPSWAANVLTYEQMDAAGWFPAQGE